MKIPGVILAMLAAWAVLATVLAAAFYRHTKASNEEAQSQLWQLRADAQRRIHDAADLELENAKLKAAINEAVSKSVINERLRAIAERRMSLVPLSDQGTLKRAGKLLVAFSFDAKTEQAFLTYENRGSKPLQPDVKGALYDDFGFPIAHFTDSWLLSSVQPGERRIGVVSAFRYPGGSTHQPYFFAIEDNSK